MPWGSIGNDKSSEERIRENCRRGENEGIDAGVKPNSIVEP